MVPVLLFSSPLLLLVLLLLGNERVDVRLDLGLLLVPCKALRVVLRDDRLHDLRRRTGRAPARAAGGAGGVPRARRGADEGRGAAGGGLRRAGTERAAARTLSTISFSLRKAWYASAFMASFSCICTSSALRIALPSCTRR